MSKKKSRRQPPIAIVGMGGLFPGSTDLRAFWGNILAKADLITEIPDTHWKASDYYSPDQKAPDMTYAKVGGFLPEVPFDTLSWGMPPNLLSSTDTSQLLGLMVARTTLQDAFKGAFDEADKSRISCLLGVTSGQELFGQMASRLRRPEWVAGMRAAGIDEKLANEAADKIGDTMVPWTESTFPGLLGNVVAGRIANRLDLGGTNAVTDAACASSFAAISMGIDELVLERADVVLTGGVDTLNDIFMYMCFSKTPALSKSGRVSPFDEKADGTLLGEGLGMVALKRLEDAERDGNHIYAVIKGVGTSSDGRSKSVYAPVSEGQANALRRAYDAAGYTPDTVELVEAHGTGTKAGDVAEIGGLKLCFDESGRKDRQWCAVGTVKSQIGHTKSAAGAGGLVKAAMALHDKVLPPTLNVDKPNPKADWENSPFYVNTETRPWVRKGDHPRRAGVSSFGFGGSNFHITLEEYTGKNRAAQLRPRSAELFAFAGADKVAVAKAARALLDEMAAREDSVPLSAWAKKAAAHYDAAQKDNKANARLLVVAKDESELKADLDKAVAALEKHEAPKGKSVFFGEGKKKDGKVAFLFSGQGSQYVNMGQGAFLDFEPAQLAWDKADALDTEKRLSSVVFPPPAFDASAKKAQQAELTQTEWAQPGIGATSLALLAVLDAVGLSPDMVGGHSYGELTALCAAGVIDEESLMRLARERGELMKKASEKDGAMAAVFADKDTVEKALKAHGGGKAVLANHNAPTQAVISGETAAVDAVVKALEADKVRVSRLPVSTAFHSPVVADASGPLGGFLDGLKFSKAKIPVYANTTAKPYPTAGKKMKTILAEQIGSPVKFVDEVQAMYDDGARVFVEVGPGRVLQGLVGKILDQQEHTALATDQKGQLDSRALLSTIGTLAAQGHDVSLHALFLRSPDVPPAPEKKRRMEIAINGSNYGKPEAPKPAPVRTGASAAPAPAARASSTPSMTSANAQPAKPAATFAPASAKPAAPRPSRCTGERSPCRRPRSDSFSSFVSVESGA
jgi:polyketide-type polyunsaturated fatty acid synthase PfaA